MPYFEKLNNIPYYSLFNYTPCWDQILSDSDLKKVIALGNEANLTPANISKVPYMQANTRKSDIAWITAQSFPDIHEQIMEVVGVVNSYFFKFDLDGCYEPYQYTVYNGEDNGFFDWHTDAPPSNNYIGAAIPRKLTVSILLNDTAEFKGGDLEVKSASNDAYKLQQAKGRAWFFPSWMLHRVSPVTEGVRKTLILWLGGPQFR